MYRLRFRNISVAAWLVSAGALLALGAGIAFAALPRLDSGPIGRAAPAQARVRLPVVAVKYQGVAPTATPTRTPTPTRTRTRTPTPTPTLTQCGFVGDQLTCFRYEPSREIMRVIGASLTLRGGAEDLCKDLVRYEWRKNGVRVSGGYVDNPGFPQAIREIIVEGGVTTWALEFFDVHGAYCMKDWVVSGVTPSPTATPTPTPTRTPTPSATPTPNIQITALEYLQQDEYVQITNPGPGPQSMAGWKVVCVGTGAQYSFPSTFAIEGGSYVRVHSGPGIPLYEGANDRNWTTSYMWNDTGDTALLKDASNNVRDSWSYP